MRSDANGGASAAHSGEGQRGLLGGLLSGLLERPAVGSELGQPAQGPPAFELLDHVDQIDVGVNAEQQAGVHEREGGSETLAAPNRAGEQEAPPRHSEEPNTSFGPAVVDLEAPILEAASEEEALVDRIGCRTAKWRFRKQLGMQLVDPGVQSVQQWERASEPFLGPSASVEATLLAVGFDVVEISEILQRDRGPPIFGQERCVEFAANVHATAETAFGRNCDQGLTGFVVFDLAGVASIAVALDETVNR